MSYVNALESYDLGTGTSYDPFEYWQAVCEYSDWVEEPNVRRKGTSGVRRAHVHGQEYFIKTQLDHFHYSWRHAFGRPTALREAEALEACHRLGILAPQIVFCQTRKVADHRHTLLVTRSLRDFVDLNGFLQQRVQAEDRQIRWRVLDRIAATLARLHSARWQHSALYAKHVLVAKRAAALRGNGAEFDIALLDLEKARRRISVSHASRHDIQQFQRHAAGLNRNDWRHFLGRYSLYLTHPTRQPAR